MKKPKAAVILFPGTNCEEETARSCISVGMDADILRWNTKEDLSSYDGFVLPGGWSYEDRVRAGAVASKDRIMETIKKEAKGGKPVLGICNGAQILIETGIVPGIKNDIQMALAKNINPLISGYYCTWVNIKNNPSNCIFTKSLGKGEIIPIPIAHGEGRFTTKEEGLLEQLIKNSQVVFKYCDEKGETIDKFPINPNGSINNIAGLCNPEGNVLAMMPHPERCCWNRQLPGFERKSFQEMNDPGPGRKLFQAMKEYIEGR
ncbi:MAG: phosphoribosylformylglycinamidine synthase I [Candidatus Aenigmarchaeota archaeon]|nr:phosphoribosylformylglycinamidine synthase I [Candidatus Aenigmarchaeota archaeon]